MLKVLPQLSPQEEDLFPEPKAIWTDLDLLTVIRPFEEHSYALGDSVFLSEAANVDSCFDDDKVLQVCNTKSEVEVLWQDGSRTWQSSTTLQQPAEIEDHHVWPGDHVIYRDEESREISAVVQSMNPKEQTACISMFGDDKEVSKTVSVLECKLEGSPDFPHGLGRGDIVLISDEDTGYTPPSVARLGKVMEEDVDEEEQEERLIFEGRAIAKMASRAQLSVQKRPRPAREAHDIDWYGVIVDCPSNGRIVVELPDGRRIEERIDRLSKLVDGFDDDDHYAASSDGSSWDSIDEEGQDWNGKDGATLDEEDGEWQDDVGCEDGSEEEMDMSVDMQSADPMPLAGFKLLDHAPSDHAFLKQSHTVAQQKSFLSRVQREHKILSSSLPGECSIAACLRSSEV
jgi:ubiquitin-conjugating enzyme E2 O